MRASACHPAEARRGSFGLEGSAQCRLRRRQPRDRHAVRRARDVVQTGLVAEEHRGRIAAMLAADADLERGPGLAAALAADLDQLADALDVERGERVVLQDAALLVLLEEGRRIVAAEAEGGLRQVVGTEAEELRRFGDLAGAQAGAR